MGKPKIIVNQNLDEPKTIVNQKFERIKNDNKPKIKYNSGGSIIIVKQNTDEPKMHLWKLFHFENDAYLKIIQFNMVEIKKKLYMKNVHF